jgi:hypothetical protein
MSNRSQLFNALLQEVELEDDGDVPAVNGIPGSGSEHPFQDPTWNQHSVKCPHSLAEARAFHASSTHQGTLSIAHLKLASDTRGLQSRAPNPCICIFYNVVRIAMTPENGCLLPTLSHVQVL